MPNNTRSSTSLRLRKGKVLDHIIIQELCNLSPNTTGSGSILITLHTHYSMLLEPPLADPD